MAPLGTRSSVIFDLDGDGDLDIVTNDFNSAPQVLVSDLAQKQPDLHWLKVRLRRHGVEPRRPRRHGPRARPAARPTRSGTTASRATSRRASLPLYFGLGDAAKIDAVEVLWPSGRKQTVAAPKVNGQIEIVEEPEAAKKKPLIAPALFYLTLRPPSPGERERGRRSLRTFLNACFPPLPVREGGGDGTRGRRSARAPPSPPTLPDPPQLLHRLLVERLVVPADPPLPVHQHEAGAVEDGLGRGRRRRTPGRSSIPSLKPSWRAGRSASSSPVRKSQRSGAWNDSAYSGALRGCRAPGRREKETKRTARSSGSSRFSRAIRAVIIGQEAGQRVKMKSAIQGLPCEVLEAYRAAVAVGEREVGRGSTAPAAAPRGPAARRRSAATPATRADHQEAPEQAAAQRGGPAGHQSTLPPRVASRPPAKAGEAQAAVSAERHRRPRQALPARARAVEHPAQGRHSIGQRISAHQRREPERRAVRGKNAPESSHMGMSTTFMMAWNPWTESSFQAKAKPSAVSATARSASTPAASSADAARQLDPGERAPEPGRRPPAARPASRRPAPCRPRQRTRETGATSTPWRKPSWRSSITEMLEKMAAKSSTRTIVPGKKYWR